LQRRQIKIVSSNGSDEMIVIKRVTNKESSKRYYQNHKEEKKIYVKRNEDRIKQYMKNYYQSHREELKSRHRACYLKRKNGMKMS
jgi:hypothetical protein